MQEFLITWAAWWMLVHQKDASPLSVFQLQTEPERHFFLIVWVPCEYVTKGCSVFVVHLLKYCRQKCHPPTVWKEVVLPPPPPDFNHFVWENKMPPHWLHQSVTQQHLEACSVFSWDSQDYKSLWLSFITDKVFSFLFFLGHRVLGSRVIWAKS